MKISGHLPSYYGGKDGEADLAPLVGAVILNIGRPEAPDERFEGGGFAIEYRPAGSDNAETIVFEFNELGMWVVEPVDLPA